MPPLGPKGLTHRLQSRATSCQAPGAAAQATPPSSALSISLVPTPVPLPAPLQHLVGVLNEYKAAHPAAPQALARRMDGALLAIGTLSDVLKVGSCGAWVAPSL